MSLRIHVCSPIACSVSDYLLLHSTGGVYNFDYTGYEL